MNIHKIFRMDFRMDYYFVIVLGISTVASLVLLHFLRAGGTASVSPWNTHKLK